MPADFRLRATTSQDSAALAELVSQSPDTGMVSFAPRYLVPFVDAVRTLHPGAVGVVAERVRDGALIGSAWVSFGRCRIHDAMTPYALLSSLVVHPDHRRKGVATALTRWRLERAVEHAADVVVLAAIQEGNRASIANARRWASQITGRVVVTPVPMRSRPPSSYHDHVRIRAVRPEELDDLAERLRAFYANYAMVTERDGAAVRTWLERSPFDDPVSSYWVAVDESDQLIAGVGIQETARMVHLHLTRMPRALRLANVAARVVPKDNVMRNLQVTWPWFAPGRLDAGRRLWQHLRWIERDRGSAIVTSLDPRGPARLMLQSQRWLPSTSFTVAIRAAVPLEEQPLLDPPF